MGGWGIVIGSGGWHVMSVVVDGDVSPRDWGMSKVVIYAAMAFGSWGIFYN